MDDSPYDHYIAIDWSTKNMAVARITNKSNNITVIDVPSDIADLKVYLRACCPPKLYWATCP